MRERVNKFNRLRPWPRIEQRHVEILRFVYRRFLKRQLTADIDVRYELGSEAADLNRLADLDLIVREADTLRPTVLGLLYLDEATDQLEELAEIVRFAHEAFRPRKNMATKAEMEAALGHAEHDEPMRTFARDLDVNFRPDGDIALHERNFDNKTFEDAILRRFRSRFEHPSSGIGRLMPDGPSPIQLRLTGVSVESFRVLEKLSIRLGSLTVLVGPNGAGKSTFLDVLGFLGTAVSDGLRAAISNEGGLERLRTHGSTGPVRLAFEFALDHGHGHVPGSYSIAFDALGDLVVVERERLAVADDTVFEKRRGQVIGDRVDPRSAFQSADDLALVTLSRDLALVQNIRQTLGRVVLVDRDPIILDRDRPTALGRGGGRRTRRPINFDQITAELIEPGPLDLLNTTVREFLPEIRRIEAVTHTGESPELLFFESGPPMRMDELSSGSRQILLYAALYSIPSPPAVVLAEEPDAGLHPSRHAPLVHLLRSLSRRCTVIATTHSPAFVDRLSASDEVLAISRAGGETRIARLSDLVRENRWLRELTAGEAFERGS